MMNRIYKIIWSKVKHRYVVVSELVRSSSKQSGGQVIKKMAAVLAVVALTAGAGGMAEAATNGSWTTATDSNGNFTAHIDTENKMRSGSKDNTVIGDENILSNLENSWIIGNKNEITGGSNAIVIGSGNTTKVDVTGTLFFGNNNKLTSSHKNSIVIGSDMEFGENAYDSIVIGNKAKNGLFPEEGSTTVKGTGANGSVVIGHEASNESAYSVVMGPGAKMGNDFSSSGRGIVIGPGAAIGNDASYSIAIGSDGTKIEDEVDYSVAIGSDLIVGAESDQVVAIGSGNRIGRDSPHSIALGSFSKIADETWRSTAVGYLSSVAGWDAIALGNSTSIAPYAHESVAIGFLAKLDMGALNSITIGSESHIEKRSTSSISIGSKSHIGDKSNSSIAIGPEATIERLTNTAIAIGSESNVGKDSSKSVAIGTSSNVSAGSEGAVALGASSSTKGDFSTALGSSAKITDFAKQALAVGYNVNTNGSYSVVLGSNASITNKVEQATVVGYESTASSKNSTLIGSKSSIGNGSAYSFVGGSESSVSDNVENATVLGSKSGVKSSGGTAIGYSTSIEENTQYSVALGSNSTVKNDDMFTSEKLTAFQASLGDFYSDKWNISSSDGDYGVLSVGDSASSQRRMINVAKGRISADSYDAINGQQIYHLTNDLTSQIANAGGVVSAGTNIASVGTGKDETSGKTAYVVNAENASVSVDDNFVLTPATDKTTNITDYNIKLNDIVTVGSTEGKKIKIDGAVGHITGLTNKTLDVAGFATVGRAATEEQLKAAMGDMKADQQLRDQHLVANPDGGNYVVDDKGEVTLKVKGAPDEDGNATYRDVVIEDVASKKKFDEIVGDGQYFDNETGKGNVVNNDMNITEAIEALDKAVDNAATEAGKHRTVSAGNGIKVEKTEATDDRETDYNVSLANDITLTGDDGTNTIHINANDGSITASQSIAVGENTYITTDGINANNQKITNVKAGEADTDAVNVSQLKGVQQQVTNNSLAINNLGNKVNQLDNRIDEVGAGAAALAALHPLDFDPDDKWDFAAGYGNYRGENSVAVGAFYRPNEDTMFSVGGTVGNGNNMVNAGVSFKFGQSNGVSTSRVAMAKEIKDLRRELEAMKSAMLDANAGRKIDTSKLQLFPDVPQNHWAYEYVATLAGNGMIQGYPDGTFDGNRPMTRYEFAAMLYRAMLNGATLSDKILTEFAPELERFTVDTVHTDKDGNPTVERVRVSKRK